jgi:hypothetical protein
MSNANINFALKSVCQQRAKQQTFNIPFPRYNIVSPYDGTYTQQQLDMRRKAEILKYSNNSSSTKTNNSSKSQRWSQLVKGNSNSQTSNFATMYVTLQDYEGNYTTISVKYPDVFKTYPADQYVTDRYGKSGLNPYAYQIVGTTGYFYYRIISREELDDCAKDNLMPTPTSACDVPGPITYLIDDETVPLYNYSKNINAYSYNSTTVLEKQWLFNPTSDILLTNGQKSTILTMLITDKINQSSYNFTLQIPFSIYVSGTNISDSLIYDPITNPEPTPSYFPNLSLGIQSLAFGVNYNGVPVKFTNNPLITIFSNSIKTPTYNNGTYIVDNFDPLQFDISFNEQISKDSPLGPLGTNDSYTANIYTGVINISNITLLTAPGYVYEFDLQMNTTNIQFPTTSLSESLYYDSAIKTTTYGVYANVSNNETVQDNCTVYPLIPTPPYQILSLFAS